MSPSPKDSYSAIMDGPDHIERPSSEAPTMQYGPHEVNQGEMSVDTPSNAFNHARHADQEISPGEENVLRSDVRPAHVLPFYLTNWGLDWCEYSSTSSETKHRVCQGTESARILATWRNI